MELRAGELLLKQKMHAKTLIHFQEFPFKSLGHNLPAERAGSGEGLIPGEAEIRGAAAAQKCV